MPRACEQRLDELAAAAEGSAERLQLQVVERNAGTLLGHVNDLLDIAKLEAGRQARTLDLSTGSVTLASAQRGQAMQLHLQTTVEGLSIAAISYYVISLLLYLAKGAKAAGLPIQPEIAAGALIPLVLWAVWRTTRRIHARLGAPH